MKHSPFIEVSDEDPFLPAANQQLLFPPSTETHPPFAVELGGQRRGRDSRRRDAILAPWE